MFFHHNSADSILHLGIFAQCLLLCVFLCLGACDNSPQDDSSDGDADMEILPDGDTDLDDDFPSAGDQDADPEADEESWETPVCLSDEPCMIAEFDMETRACISRPLCDVADRESCVTYLDESDCYCQAGAYRNEQSASCLSGEESGVDCHEAILLPTHESPIRRSTRGGGRTHMGSCGASGGVEQVYYFFVTEPLRLTVSVEGYNTLLYLRRADCEDAAAELACDDNSGEGFGSLIEVDLEADLYFLFVDGGHPDGAPVQILADFGCAAGEYFNPLSGLCISDPCVGDSCEESDDRRCLPIDGETYRCDCLPGFVEEEGACLVDEGNAGESCRDAVALTGISGSLQGSTAEAQGDVRAGCTGLNLTGPDRVYTFLLEEERYAYFAARGDDKILHLRSECDKFDTELICSDSDYGDGVELGGVLEPGRYYLFVDSFLIGGEYELDYEFREDPCGDELCPGEPECKAKTDWSGYECDCGEGRVPHGETCVDDPCDPNPCTENHRSACISELPGDYQCACDYAYTDDGEGGCMVDPEGNQWTFLVYLNADNNLERWGFLDLKEMLEVGSTRDVHIVLLMDSATRDGGVARRLFVGKDRYEVLEEIEEIDMGDWQSLADFGVWAVDAYPAKHTALVLWNHGNGWKEAAQPAFKGFSSDDHGSEGEISISNGDFTKALVEITEALERPLDIVAFDACYMGMWEVAQASVDYASLFIGSQFTIPDSGYPYKDLLQPLVDDPQMTPVELGSLMVESYYQALYTNRSLSLIDLEAMAELNLSLNAFATALMNHPDYYPNIEAARLETTDIDIYSTYRDLRGFVANVSQLGDLPADISDAALVLIEKLDQSILKNRVQTGFDDATGLSIYLSADDAWVHPDYVSDQSPWYSSSLWDDFLLDYSGLPDLK